VADGLVPRDEVDNLLLMAAVWVDWSANDADEVYENNERATRASLEAATAGRPALEEILAALETPFNAFYRPR